ncbi:hypothetical protein G3I77_02350 [Streptomyces sp. D2-8]|uniref:hypothetical protein n=1 Tax=Streptomyces sp. D2-8 TaxID=2707767 RepID=UPI0020C00DE0|nr:hypothetical protein [Streptomyces sp. D2-8]MCK8431905.1 hypothetical protein [Streptomyces sp. D2-8]
MSEVIRTYEAFRTWQTPESKPLILFSAPAVDIEKWAGVPQRRRLDEEETSGFQREEDPTRVRELTKFFSNHRNVAQNPLLGALQDHERIEFKELKSGSPFGTLRITYEDYSQVPMIDLLRRLVARLEARVSILDDSVVDENRVAVLLERENLRNESSSGSDEDDESEGQNDETVTVAEAIGEDSDDAGTIMLAEETHLVDFYTELKGRIRVLEHLGIQDADSVQGFTKSALLGYLKPVVLVDGQHRLRGAVVSASHAPKTPEGQAYILTATAEGMNPADAERQLILRESRQLPFSLLMDDSPSEHVFQFVVVNQKAIPMGKALLGTIVSTSLSREELEPVAERLQKAGIKLEDSQAVAYLTRAEGSPFRGLVQTGMGGDRTDLLQWSVLQGLVSIFRKLQGGKPYHAKVDYAREWKKEYFPQCGLVSGESETERLEEWSRPDGPWRDVFIQFYTRIRDYFGDPVDVDTFNGWGSTATSNLFNKISLTILATDYFDYIYTQAEPLENMADFSRTLDEWLKNGRVSSSYFNRNWRLERTKKDQRVVKELWSQNWHEYRKVPTKLPHSFKP